MSKSRNARKLNDSGGQKSNVADRDINQITQLEHVKSKSMWGGSQDYQDSPYYLIKVNKSVDGEFNTMEQEQISYVPVINKCVEEILGNATDQYIHYKKQVTDIKINLDKKGIITIFNNGKGFGIVKKKNLRGQMIYTPQMAASEFQTGDNLVTKKKNIKAGTNGAGLKVANAFSEWMTISTSDKKRGLYYTQKFTDRLSVIHEPEIIKLNKSHKIGTTISFKPIYKKLGIKKSYFKLLHRIIESLAYKCSSYVDANLYFNDELVPVKTFNDFVELFTDTYKSITITPKGESKEWPWNIAVAESAGHFTQFTMVNGIHIPAGGNHINFIKKQILNFIAPLMNKELKKIGAVCNKNIIGNHMFIFINGPIPDAVFESQTKVKILDSVEKFKGYILPNGYLKKIWLMLKPSLMRSFLQGYGNKPTKVIRRKISVKKYQRARFAGSKKYSKECSLIICEGDAAWGTCSTGINSKYTKLSNDFYGIFSIQGVPVNVFKNSVILDGKRIPNKKLRDNERFSSLIKVLGLDRTKSYDNTAKGNKDFAALRYGHVDVLVDQDTDGRGQIFGLLIVFFISFWPALFKRGFIRRLDTPIIRAYPKNRSLVVEVFYSNAEFLNFESKFDSPAQMRSRYEIRYYKGLGGHAEILGEISAIFSEYLPNLKVYDLDKEALKTSNIFYEESTARRKKILCSPHIGEHTVDTHIKISDQMHIDTKEYQRDNITRKIPGLDGLVVSRRKVLFTAQELPVKLLKVQKLAGETVSRAGYAHGESSLEQTIIRMGQEYKGVRNLPLLRAYGVFGTREKGYKNPASARYLKTIQNDRLMKQLFRPADKWLLDYVFDEGNRYQPVIYCPILPYVLMENWAIPGTGWAILTWARFYDDIIKNLRNMIRGKQKKCKPLIKFWRGKIRKVKGKEYSMARFTYNAKKNYIHITELPLGVYSEKYILGNGVANCICINNLEYVEEVIDKTGYDGVDITIYMVPGAIDAIRENYGDENFSAIVKYFKLSKKINHIINLIDENGNVVEYDNYAQVFDAWFKYRKIMYGKRIDRELITIKLWLIYYNNVQRYAKEYSSYGFSSRMTELQINNIISENKYTKLNIKMLTTPGYTKNENIRHDVLNINADYTYLTRLSVMKLNSEESKKTEIKIKKLMSRMDEIKNNTGAFKGSNIWEKELNEIDETIRLGQTVGWGYGKDKVNHGIRKKSKK